MGPMALPVHHVHILCDLIHPDLKVPNVLSLALFFLKSGTIYNCSDGLLHLGGLTASWINWFKTNRSSSPLHQLLTGLGFCFQPAPQPPPTRTQHFAYMAPRHTCRYLTLPNTAFFSRPCSQSPYLFRLHDYLCGQNVRPRHSRWD